MATANNLVSSAASQVGYRATSRSGKFCDWYGMQDFWCAMFVSWAAAHSGNAGVIPRHALCAAGANWFKARGQWHPGLSGARRGDIIYYKFGSRGNYVNHVGIIESVNANGTVTVIEGNTNAAGSTTGGAVMRKIRGSSGVVGRGRPAYSGAPPAGGIAVDGLWGTSTTTALQRRFGLVADGEIWDQDSGHRAKNPGLGTGWRWTSNPQTGSPLIRAMQTWLQSTGNYLEAIDALAGPNFFGALQVRMNTPMDRVISEPSPAVMEMQRRLNTGTL